MSGNTILRVRAGSVRGKRELSDALLRYAPYTVRRNYLSEQFRLTMREVRRSRIPTVPAHLLRRARIARSLAVPARVAILAVVRRIPRGRVASYGVVARLAGLPGHARQVGYALHALPDGKSVPWHRVVNVRGEIVVRDAGGLPTLAPARQRALLEAEGVGFDSRGRVVMGRHGWEGAGKGER